MPDRKASPRPNSAGKPTPEPEVAQAPPAAPDGPSYVGTLPDDVPNEDYTLAGQVRVLNT